MIIQTVKEVLLFIKRLIVGIGRLAKLIGDSHQLIIDKYAEWHVPPEKKIKIRHEQDS